MTPEWHIIASSLNEPGMGTGRPLLNCGLRKPAKLTRNASLISGHHTPLPEGASESPASNREPGSDGVASGGKLMFYSFSNEKSGHTDSQHWPVFA